VDGPAAGADRAAGAGPDRSNDVDEPEAGLGRAAGAGPDRSNEDELDPVDPTWVDDAAGLSRSNDVEPPARAAGGGGVDGTAGGPPRSKEVDRSSDELASAVAGAGRVVVGRVVVGLAGRGGSVLVGRGGSAGVRAVVGRGGAAGVRAVVGRCCVACALARPATKSAIGELAGRTGRERRRRKGRSGRLAARSGAE